MKPFSSIVLVFAIALTCPSLKAQQYPPDVSGLQIGTPLSVAKAKLTGFRVVTLAQKDPQSTSIVAYSNNEAWVFVAIDDKLAYIQHKLVYPDKATMPLYEETAQRLKQKYGSLGLTDYDSSGKIVPHGPRSPCQEILVVEMNPPLIDVQKLIPGLPPNNILTSMYLPIRFKSTCSESVMVDLGANVNITPGKTLVDVLIVTLADQRPLFAEAQRLQKSQQAPLPDDSKRARPPI
jgi:hypothetical protein